VLATFGRVLTVVILVGAMAFTLGRAVNTLLPNSPTTSTSAGIGELLDQAQSGTESGGSEIDRPSPNSPFEYPAAVISVLFRPTIFEANSGAGAVAAIETTVLLLLFALSWKRLRNVPAMAFRRPYVLFCVVYTGIFAFAWSSFANLGALARQRVQVWPFLLLLLALPRVLPPSDRSVARRADHLVAR
jgi:hypothetical protein